MFSAKMLRNVDDKKTEKRKPAVLAEEKSQQILA